MNLQDIANCSRPVCFDLEEEFNEEYKEIKYSMAGTCFVVRYERLLYAITAKHVIRNVKPESILIPYHLGSEDFLPIFSRIDPKTELKEDTDHTDFVIFGIDESKIDTKIFKENTVFTISNRVKPDTFFSDKLFICGFSFEFNKIDYEKKRLKQRRFQVTGKKLGKTDYEGIIEFELDNRKELNSYEQVTIDGIQPEKLQDIYINGMSGSPVFLLKKIDDYKLCLILDGMVIRENYYLDFIYIAKAIQMDIDNNYLIKM